MFKVVRLASLIVAAVLLAAAGLILGLRGVVAQGVKPAPAGPIPVAVALTDGATMIDFAGPWEVFQDVDTDMAARASGSTLWA